MQAVLIASVYLVLSVSSGFLGNKKGGCVPPFVGC